MPDLRLFLLRSGQVRPEEYAVFATRDLVFPWGGVRLHVIGASSLVLVRSRAGEYAEVIACGQEPDRAARLAEARVGVPGSLRLLVGEDGAFRYRASLYGTPLGGMSPTGGSEELSHALEHRFPGPGSPLTRIEAGGDGRAFSLRTRHDYPEEEVTVWSESFWEFGEG